MWYGYKSSTPPARNHSIKTEDFDEACAWLKTQESKNAFIIDFSDRTKYYKWEIFRDEEESKPEAEELRCPGCAEKAHWKKFDSGCPCCGHSHGRHNSVGCGECKCRWPG